MAGGRVDGELRSGRRGESTELRSGRRGEEHKACAGNANMQTMETQTKSIGLLYKRFTQVHAQDDASHVDAL